jgi:hypothetical protein
MSETGGFSKFGDPNATASGFNNTSKSGKKKGKKKSKRAKKAADDFTNVK